MLSRVHNIMILLRGQMWLIPAIMIALGLALAYVLLNHGPFCASGTRTSGGSTAAMPARPGNSIQACSPA
jgi:hypothetical protein